MNASSEYYERRAEYCEQMARQAPTPTLRLDWLRLASQWRDMIRAAPGQDALPEDRPQPHPGETDREQRRGIAPRHKGRD